MQGVIPVGLRASLHREVLKCPANYTRMPHTKSREAWGNGVSNTSGVDSSDVKALLKPTRAAHSPGQEKVHIADIAMHFSELNVGRLTFHDRAALSP